MVINAMKRIQAISLLLLTLFIAGCGDDEQAPPSPPVVVSKPVLAEVTDYLEETGNTVAYNSVDLVARVDGYLNIISFTDGTYVKKGDPLFVIQPEPYAAQVEEAEASLAQSRAEYAYDQAEYQRQLVMYKQNATSMADVQKWLSQRDSTKASIDGAIANLEIAKINYGYTHISAPFDGRIGRHLIDVGNLVGNGGATKLATIDQIDPLYVYFNVNELDVLKIRAIARKNGFKPGDIDTIPVYVGLQNEDGYPHEGHLDFSSTGLDSSTGTIQIRGVLSNKDQMLIPGLFVRARIALGPPSQQLTVPQTAVLYDQIGPYIFIVDKTNTVVQSRVVTGSVNLGMISIIKGLKADDRVVILGLQNATPGNKVAPTEKDLAAPASENIKP